MDSGDISGNTPESDKSKSPDSQDEAIASSPDKETGSETDDSKSISPVETSSAEASEPVSTVHDRSLSEASPQATASPQDSPTGSESAQPETVLPTKPYPWIIHPAIDYLFVAGGLAFIVIAANYFVLGWKVPVDRNLLAEAPFVISMYFCQHLFANTHNIVTYIRLFNSEEAKRKYRFYRTWLAYAFIAILLLGSYVLPGEFATGLTFLFTLTIFIHFCLQAFGICKIYCYKRGYSLNEVESEIFRWLMLSMGVSFSSRFFLRKPWLRLAPTARLSHSGYYWTMAR